MCADCGARFSERGREAAGCGRDTQGSSRCSRSCRRPSCPLNHSPQEHLYPQMWTKNGSPVDNRQLARATGEADTELQPCKLPTLWITPVENFPERRRAEARRPGVRAEARPDSAGEARVCPGLPEGMRGRGMRTGQGARCAWRACVGRQRVRRGRVPGQRGPRRNRLRDGARVGREADRAEWFGWGRAPTGHRPSGGGSSRPGVSRDALDAGHS